MEVRKPLIATVTVLGSLMALLLAAMFIVETRWFSSYLTNKLSERLGQEVKWQGPLHIDWSLNPTVRIAQLHIDNPAWAQHALFAAAHEITARLALPKLMQGVVAVDYLQVEQPRMHLMEHAQYGSNWSMLASEKKSQKPPLFTLKLKELSVSEGKMTYLKPAANTALTAHIHSHEGQPLSIRGDGRFRGETLRLRIIGEPLEEVVTRAVARVKPVPGDGYSLTGRVAWRDHRLRIDGTTSALTSIEQLQFKLSLAGPNAQALAQLANADAYAAPYQLQAHIAHQHKKWTLTAINGTLGNTTLGGQLSYDASGEHPTVTADLNLSALDLTRIGTGGNSPADATGAGRRVSETFQQTLERLRHYRAQVTVNVGRLQTQQWLAQELHAQITLADGSLAVKPLRFAIGGGQVDLQANVRALPAVSEVEAKVRAAAAIKITEVDLGQAMAAGGYEHLGHLAGDLHLQFDNQALRVTNSRLHYWDKQHQTDLMVTATPWQTADAGVGIEVKGEGKVNGSELTLRLAGGPLLDINANAKPYPLEARLSLGATTISAKGTLTQPLAMAAADVHIAATGQDPAQLNPLLPTHLPHLPSYELSAHLLREENVWYLRSIRAELGTSDVSGNVRWATNRDERPRVHASLQSRHLHLDTLTSSDSRPSSGSQAAGASASGTDEQVIPSNQLPKQLLQGFDAHIDYTAERVTASNIPLDDIQATLSLVDGVVQLEPLTFGVGQGGATLRLQADTALAPASGHASVDINRLPLNELLAPFELADESFGLLGGRGEFHFSGNSLAQALASLNGELQLIINGGRVDATLVEALGLDAGELVLGLFGDGVKPVDVQCAYTKLKADDGMVDVSAFTIATVDSNFLGDGEANLKKETFELALEAHPKDFSVFSGSSPIRVHGTFSEPRVDVISDELTVRGALAAIGAAVFPPAALLPLVEFGTTEGASGCKKAVASLNSPG